MGRVVDQVFLQYENLADYYANKIWNEENLGIEKEDLAQELKIRLFLAIKRYATKWKEFKDTGKNKPVPMEFYIKTTMINKCRDLIKEINAAKFHKISHIGYDRGIEVDELIVERMEVFIGSQKLSDLFGGEERRVFKLLVLFNFDIEKARKAYKGKKNCGTIMKRVNDKLKEYLENNLSNVNEFEIFVNQE